MPKFHSCKPLLNVYCILAYFPFLYKVNAFKEPHVGVQGLMGGTMRRKDFFM